MRLRYAGQVHDGVEGSYCWPDHRQDDGSMVGICADKILWGGLTGAIHVEPGSTVTIEIEAEEAKNRFGHVSEIPAVGIRL